VARGAQARVPRACVAALAGAPLLPHRAASTSRAKAASEGIVRGGVVCAVVRLLSEDLSEFEHGLALGRALGRTKAIVVDGRSKLLCGG